MSGWDSVSDDDVLAGDPALPVQSEVGAAGWDGVGSEPELGWGDVSCCSSNASNDSDSIPNATAVASLILAQNFI